MHPIKRKEIKVKEIKVKPLKNNCNAKYGKHMDLQCYFVTMKHNPRDQ